MINQSINFYNDRFLIAYFNKQTNKNQYFTPKIKLSKKKKQLQGQQVQHQRFNPVFFRFSFSVISSSLYNYFFKRNFQKSNNISTNKLQKKPSKKKQQQYFDLFSISILCFFVLFVIVVVVKNTNFLLFPFSSSFIIQCNEITKKH